MQCQHPWVHLERAGKYGLGTSSSRGRIDTPLGGKGREEPQQLRRTALQGHRVHLRPGAISAPPGGEVRSEISSS